MTMSLEDRVRLSKIEPWRWVRDLVIDWATVISGFVLFWLLGKKLWLAPFAAMIIGAGLNALGSLAHESAHKMAFKNRRLNDLFGEVFIAWPLFTRIADNYRLWHFEHHRHLGTDKDSELPFRSGRMFEGPVPFRRVVLCFVLDFVGFGIPNLLAFFKDVFPRRKLNILPPMIVWGVFLGITVWLDALWVFALYTYSLVCGFWAMSRVRTYSEHIALSDETFPAYRFEPGPIGRFFFFHHNGWCHYEHHLFPQIPYYNLPKVRALDPNAKVITAVDLFWNYERHTGGERTTPIDGAVETA